MGVVHVVSKFDLDNGTWKFASGKERFRSFAMAYYPPIINSNDTDLNYIIVAYGSRVEDHSRDSINIKDRSAKINKIVQYFSRNSNKNFVVNYVMLDADAPLIEQSKQLALYIDELATNPNVKTINLLGQSKCGAMNMYVPRYFNNLRSFSVTNIYNVSTPYNGTLLASPLYFYPEVDRVFKDMFGKKVGKLAYKSGIKIYESISSNSHMDYDIARSGGVPSDWLNKYDPEFIKNIFCDENLYALDHCRSFNNITTFLDKDAIDYALKTGDVVTIGLYLLDTWFFNKESDGLVKTTEQHIVEDYLDIDKRIDLSSSHMITTGREFYKILDCINETVEKPSQRIR